MSDEFLKSLWRAQMLDVAEALLSLRGERNNAFVQNKIVILPEERISLTVPNPNHMIQK